MSESYTQPVALTPSTYMRFVNYANKRQWTLSAAACALIEDGIDGEARRAELAGQARQRPDYDALAEEFRRGI
jgi:hypothetical protein